MRRSLRTVWAVLAGMALILCASEAQAVIEGYGIFDSVKDKYQNAASGWARTMTDAATRLFWALAVISMVWTFGTMALRRADIGEFFGEFIRFTVFTGFFWWGLTNGPALADSMYRSLQQLAGEASGLGGNFSPSGIVDVGFAIFDKVLASSSFFDPMDSLIGILMALVILIMLALVSLNMLVVLVEAWILAYGGVFFLGFGGSRWTSDMAINYYKTVLGTAARLMAMVLLVGIGKTFLDDYYANLEANPDYNELAVMIVVALILLVLVSRIPPLVSGIITGASISGGSGPFSGGSLMSLAMTSFLAVRSGGRAGAAAAAGGQPGAVTSGGGTAAVENALRTGGERAAGHTGSGLTAGQSRAGTGGDTPAEGPSPFSQAAGFAGSFGAGQATGSRSDSGKQGGGGERDDEPDARDGNSEGAGAPNPAKTDARDWGRSGGRSAEPVYRGSSGRGDAVEERIGDGVDAAAELADEARSQTRSGLETLRRSSDGEEPDDVARQRGSTGRNDEITETVRTGQRRSGREENPPDPTDPAASS